MIHRGKKNNPKFGKSATRYVRWFFLYGQLFKILTYIHEMTDKSWYDLRTIDGCIVSLDVLGSRLFVDVFNMLPGTNIVENKPQTSRNCAEIVPGLEIG